MIELRDPRRAFHVVDQFEQELCDYTGAPHAIAVDSCTNALFLALYYERRRINRARLLDLPRRTYVGVLQAARNAGWHVRWNDLEWQKRGQYELTPTRVVDSARRFDRQVYQRQLRGAIVCVSFHAAKQLPLGRGGAILTDDPDVNEWTRAARADGRGPDGVTFPGWHCYMPPPTAALGLWTLVARRANEHAQDEDLSLYEYR